MARVYQAQPIPGVKDLMTLLDFLKNKEAYEQQIHDLTMLHEELSDLVAKVGKVEEIESLHGQAAQAKLQADQYLADAHAKAKAILDEADAHRNAIMEELDAKAAAHAGLMADLKAKHEVFEEKRKAAEAVLGKRDKALAEKEEAAAKAKADAD
ncbi:MAG TPA: hypothetical protein VIU43_01230, partial [Nitrosospira sp.]